MASDDLGWNGGLGVLLDRRTPAHPMRDFLTLVRAESSVEREGKM